MKPQDDNKEACALRWRLALVVALAVVLRLSWCLSLPDRFFWADESNYDAVARNLLNHGSYSLDSVHPTAFRAPGQVLFMSAVYAVCGPGVMAARVWQALLWGLAVWLAFRVARELGASERASLWAAAAAAVYPAYIYAAGALFPLTVFTTALLAGTLGLLRVYNGGGWGAVLLAGTGLGAGTLTIPYLAPAMLLAVLWLGRGRWRKALGVAAVALLIVSPWPLRNWAVFGEPVMGTQQWINFWLGNNPHATATTGSEGWMLRRERNVWVPYRDSLRADELGADRLLRESALRYVAEHPARTAWLWLKKGLNLFRLWPATETQNAHTTWTTKLLGAISFGPVLALGVLGWWRGGLDRRRAAVVAIYFATFVAVAAVTISKDRFRMPLDVYLMIFAAVAVERWLAWHNAAGR
ncbi:MAG: glycosyltransferase family 39 protein [Verrucomicrobia bacterium]|nr:glycosyltransferase family 39 protein [Verrucomicrobiota bacterium]